MPNFEAWQVVKVPFPYTDRPVRQRRPVVVIGAVQPVAGHDMLWVLMITSADNRSWTSDVAVSDLGMAGLPSPSVVRVAKIATIEAREAEAIGVLPIADRIVVLENVLAGLPTNVGTVNV